MTSINFAALAARITAATESNKPLRTITGPASRPVRDIRKEMSKATFAVVNEVQNQIQQLKESIFPAIVTSVLSMYGKTFYAKGANWNADHDDCARVLRTQYNAHCAAPGENMKESVAREVWNLAYSEANPDAPAPAYRTSVNEETGNSGALGEELDENGEPSF